MAIVPIEIKGVVKRIRAVDASPEHKDIALQVLLEMLAKQIPHKNDLQQDLALIKWLLIFLVAGMVSITASMIALVLQLVFV